MRRVFCMAQASLHATRIARSACDPRRHQPRPFLAAYRIKVKRALFNEIATSGYGAPDGRLPLRIDQTNVPLAGSMSGSARAVPVSVVVAALLLTGCNANQAINPSGAGGPLRE